MYAVKGNHDRPIIFASRFYIEARGTHSDSYNIVIYIMTAMALLPLLSFIIFFTLAILFVYEKILQTAENIRTAAYYNREIVAAIFLTSASLHIALILCHCISLKSFIDYGYDVLRYDAEDENSIHKEGDKQPFIHSIISGIIAAGIFLVAAPIAMVYGIKERDWKVPFSISLTVNFIYIGFNFLPYMLMAFINDPTQTLFTYMLIIVLVICVCCIFMRLIKTTAVCRARSCRWSKCWKASLLLIMTIALFLLVILIMVIISNWLTLGNLHDFKDIENISIPFVGALIAYALISPIYHLLREWYNQLQNANPIPAPSDALLREEEETC